MMDHPIVKNMMSTGEPDGVVHEQIGTDYFGNPLYPTYQVYKLNDELFDVEHLTSDSIEILKIAGAERQTL